MLLLGSGLLATASLSDAPSFVDSILSTFGGSSADPQDISTSLLSWSAGETIIAMFGTSGSVDLSGLTGSTDDTSSLLAGKDTNEASLIERLVTVQGGSLDATLSFNLSSARRAVAALATFSGVSSITTPVRDQGTFDVEGIPVSPSFSVTGVKNRVLIATVNVRGGSSMGAPAAPSGYTLGGQGSNGAGATTSSLNTFGWAYKVAALSNGTIPAATWTGFGSATDQQYQIGHFALEPA